MNFCETTNIPNPTATHLMRLPFQLLIDVEDSGSPILVSTVVLTIFITSVNDEKPQMVNLPSEVDVVENTPIGSIILGCTLMDADSARLPVGVARARIAGECMRLLRFKPVLNGLFAEHTSDSSTNYDSFLC